jgi:hypothetical protein
MEMDEKKNRNWNVEQGRDVERKYGDQDRGR